MPRNLDVRMPLLENSQKLVSCALQFGPASQEALRRVVSAIRTKEALVLVAGSNPTLLPLVTFALVVQLTQQADAL